MFKKYFLALGLITFLNIVSISASYVHAGVGRNATEVLKELEENMGANGKLKSNPYLLTDACQLILDKNTDEISKTKLVSYIINEDLDAEWLATVVHELLGSHSIDLDLKWAVVRSFLNNRNIDSDIRASMVQYITDEPISLCTN